MVSQDRAGLQIHATELGLQEYVCHLQHDEHCAASGAWRGTWCWHVVDLVQPQRDGVATSAFVLPALVGVAKIDADTACFSVDLICDAHINILGH